MTVLYHAQPRLYSLKPLIALEEKQAEYDRREIAAEPLERAVPGFPPAITQRISVEGDGPVLVHDGETIVSSFFMLEYIAESFAGPALLPDDALGRYRAQSIGQVVALMIAPFVSAVALARHPLPAVDLVGVEPFERRQAWERGQSGSSFSPDELTGKLRPTLAKLNAMLTSDWFLGTYSIADIDVFAMVRDLPELVPGLLKDAAPALRDFIARMEARPAVGRALTMTWREGAPAYLPGPEISRWG